MRPSREIATLLEVMAALRDPETGCPWDVKQDFSTIAPYAIEEAHEVADAIARNDMVDLPDELGDLLLQVVFHAQMAKEADIFDFGDVVEAITTKMIRRHPHVFGDKDADGAESVRVSWEEIKAAERAAKGKPDAKTLTSRLDRFPASLPPMLRAVKYQKEAAKIGFDWPDITPVFGKVREEIDELEHAVSEENADRDAIREEAGDLLFAIANLCRHAGVDPEQALIESNAKFARRFAHVEQCARDETPDDTGKYDLYRLESFWQAAKSLEKAKK